MPRHLQQKDKQTNKTKTEVVPRVARAAHFKAQPDERMLIWATVSDSVNVLFGNHQRF